MTQRYSLASLGRLALLPLAALVLAAAPTASAQSTIVVNSSADGPVVADASCTLREAVQSANTNTAVGGCTAGSVDGDRVTFAATVVAPIVLSAGELTITDDVTIDGARVAGRVTVDANNASRIFDVDAPVGTGAANAVAFTSLILQNGNSGAGGSAAPDAGGAVDLKSGSTATFIDVDVTGSTAGINGGGIHGASNTTIDIRATAGGGSLISDNEAQGNESNRGGGGVWGAGIVRITGPNVVIDNNRATGTSGSGGGVFNLGGTLIINGTVTISNNTANRAGGGIETAGGTVTTTGATTLQGNDAGANPGNGGGLHAGGSAVVSLTGLVATNNTAVEGGGLWNSGSGRMSLSGVAVTTNIATGTNTGGSTDAGGGGVYNDGGELHVDAQTTLNGNRATGASASGGGILNNGGYLKVTNAAITNNTASRAGGGVESADGTVFLIDVVLNANVVGTAPGNGGGFHGGGTANVSVLRGAATGNQAGSEGGGYWISGNGLLTIHSTRIAGNTAAGAAAENGGGGVYNDGGRLDITGSMIESNTATGDSGSGGGVLNNGGRLLITVGTIQNNAANRAGGGVESAGGTVTVNGTVFQANVVGTAPGNGGGLHTGGATTVSLVNAEFRSNRAVEGGGFWISGGSVLTASGLKVIANAATGADAAQGGGGFYNEGGRATITGSSFQRNTANGTSGSGGGILNNNGMLTVRSTDFTANAAARAGGGVEDRAGDVSTGSLVALDRVVLEGNTTGSNPGNGGGLHITGAGRVTVDSSRVVRNGAGNQGGGLWNSGLGSLTVTYTSVTDNTSSVGGGLYQQGGGNGLLSFSNGLVARNASSVTGGGFAIDGATLQIENSTVSTNRAVFGGGGAARAGRVLMSNATVARNVATEAGGGLSNTGPNAVAQTLSLDNTIVADNVSNNFPDLAGVVMSRGYNLFETTTGATITMDAGAGPDIVGVDPGLGPLADNGGPTLTHAIPESSPAVNQGWTALTIDQRGVTRVSTPDIGAFESAAAPTPREGFETEFAEGEEMRMSTVAPNPFRADATMSLAVRQSQAVRVVLYDVMGREVRVLHDGPVAASTEVEVSVDGRGLASGVYVVVVRGESVQGTQRITIAR